MPKVRLTEAAAERERLQANLDVVRGRRKAEEMADAMGVCTATYYNKAKDPEELTLREVRLLCKRFKIDRAKFITDVLSVG